MEHEKFLGQVVPAGQPGEPGRHPVDLVGGDLADYQPAETDEHCKHHDQ